jgi:SAM-dependent methyltransferase
VNTHKAPVELEFSAKYDRTHAEQYLQKHRSGLARRLSHRRDEQLARYALKLAGDPRNVLDLPCGAGRFWPVLLENQDRTLLAADNSPEMLEVAANANPAARQRGVGLLRTSAFAIDLPDLSTDCIFCMRLLHHIGKPEDRLAILREFNRVSRDTAIVSLWVDGNFKAWRRRRREAGRNYGKPGDYQNRFLIPARTIEQEFAAAGFSIRGYRDFIPGYAMWRVYVLQKNAPR